MIEPRRQLGAQFEMLGPELLRNLLQGLKMRRWITVAKRVVGDECKPTLKESAQ